MGERTAVTCSLAGICQDLLSSAWGLLLQGGSCPSGSKVSSVVPCGAHGFILYLQAGFRLSPPLSSHAEDAPKARQLLLLPDGLYGLYTTHPSWHPEEEESSQANCVPFFLTGTIPLP